MNDSEARGLVLKRLYDIRGKVEHARPNHFDDLQFEPGALVQIVEQLAQEKLIDWTPHRALSGIDTFLAHINVFGVKVVEGTERSHLAITIDSSVHVHGSQNVQIGGQGNVQTVTMDIEKMMSAVDSSGASFQEKEEAKSLLTKIIENKLVQTVLGDWFRKCMNGT